MVRVRVAASAALAVAADARGVAITDATPTTSNAPRCFDMGPPGSLTTLDGWGVGPVPAYVDQP
jgi:hypothetical protein